MARKNIICRCNATSSKKTSLYSTLLTTTRLIALASSALLVLKLQFFQKNNSWLKNPSVKLMQQSSSTFSRMAWLRGSPKCSQFLAFWWWHSWLLISRRTPLLTWLPLGPFWLCSNSWATHCLVATWDIWFTPQDFLVAKVLDWLKN